MDEQTRDRLTGASKDDFFILKLKSSVCLKIVIWLLGSHSLEGTGAGDEEV